MREFRASLVKEALLLRRDVGALIILFVMPLLLVICISMVQHGTFKSMTEVQVDAVLVDRDHGKVAQHLRDALTGSGRFNIQVVGDADSAKAVVLAGKAQLAILLPEQLTKHTHGLVRAQVNKLLVRMELSTDTLPGPLPGNAEPVLLIFDPATQPAFRAAVKMGLQQVMLRVETEELITSLEEQMDVKPDAAPVEMNGFIPLEEQAVKQEIGPEPDSTQHNVPAWTVFAIFFLIVPLSIGLVKEKAQRTYIRLKASGTSTMVFMLSKVVVYLGVALLQFTSILLLGVFLFPYLGLPGLAVAGYLPLLYFTALMIGLAAIGLGALIGAVSTSHEQAAPFGATLVVILSAIGGIWVPVFAMPPVMQKLSMFSPLNWGLSAFHEVLLRHGTLTDLLLWFSALLLFFAVTAAIAVHQYAKKSVQ